MYKVCTDCKKEKNISFFGKDVYSKDGKSYSCKLCRNEKSKQRERKKTLFKCISCGIEKKVDFYTNKKRKTKFCLMCLSAQTQKNIKKPHMSGSNSKRWKGGEYCSSDGYKMIKCDMEFTDSGRQKYKKEHILVYENHIGRQLKTQKGHMGEQIHHIDGDKLNNSLENLILCINMSEHRTLHCQLEKIAYDLVKRGVIKFDKYTKKYYADLLNERRIN